MIKKNSRRALTDEQVKEVRELYWLEGMAYVDIGVRYHVTERTVRTAVQSIGSYAEVPDTITKTQKENRVHPNTITGDYAGLAKKRRQRAINLMNQKEIQKAEDERIKAEREKANDPFRQAYPRSFS